MNTGLNTRTPAMKDEADQFVVSPTNWAGIIDQALAPPRTRKSYQKSYGVDLGNT